VLESDTDILNLVCTDTEKRTVKSGDKVSITYSDAITGDKKYVF